MAPFDQADGLASGLISGLVTGADVGVPVVGDALLPDELQAPTANAAARMSRASKDFKVASS